MIDILRFTNFFQMRYLRIIIICVFWFSCFSACKSVEGKDEVDENIVDQMFNENALVQIAVANRQTFDKQIIGNGKLSSVQKAELKFETGGELERILVRNGDKVVKGQLLANLGVFKLQNSFDKSKVQLRSAELELQNILLGAGFNTNDTLSVPAEFFESAKIKSGYGAALNQYKLALYELASASLYAPFGGVVANLNAQAFCNVSQSDVFCTVFDDSAFEAEFSIIESELGDVSKNMRVSVVLFVADTLTYQGVISEINPVVEQNGLVRVKALIHNTNGRLFEGMNVKVIVRNSVPNQLIVPRQAIVMRSGREVVFTYQNGLAKWNYVKTGFENADAFTISEGLKDGDSIIVSGNLNLGHDAKVTIEQ